MKLLITGDLHLKRGELDDQTPVLDNLAGEAFARGASLVIINGDLSGTSCPHLSRPDERQALLAFIVRLTASGTRVLVLRGNHDVAEDWAWLSAVPLVRFVERPETLKLEDALSNMRALHLLPYPDRSWVAQSAASGVEASAAMGAAIASILTGFAVAAEGRPSILVGHLATTGALASTGQPIIGSDVEVPAALLGTSGASLALLNHIHLPQEIQAAGCEVVHVGSPWGTNYGELEQKRAVLVDWTDPQRPTWESLPTPSVRRVVRDWTWEPEARLWTEPEAYVAGERDRVKLRLRYTEGDQVDLAAAKAAGAHVTEHVVTRHTRDRAPEVRRAVGPREKLEAFEKSEGREIDPDFEAALVAVLGGVEVAS